MHRTLDIGTPSEKSRGLLDEVLCDVSPCGETPARGAVRRRSAGRCARTVPARNGRRISAVAEAADVFVEGSRAAADVAHVPRAFRAALARVSDPDGRHD